MTIKGRLSKLEEKAHPTQVVVVWRNAAETEDSAIDRWMAANPNKPDPRQASVSVQFVGWQSAEKAERQVR